MLAKEAILFTRPATELMKLNSEELGNRAQLARVVEDPQITTFTLGLEDIAISVRYMDDYNNPDGSTSSIIAVFAGEGLDENGLIINLDTIKNKEMVEKALRHGLNRAVKVLVPEPPKKPQGLLKTHNR